MVSKSGINDFAPSCVDMVNGVAVDFGQNVKEHAPLSARASVDHGVEVETTDEHENRAADRGCCVSSCSDSSLFGWPFERELIYGDGKKVINLGTYRESKWQILWADEKLNLAFGGESIPIHSDVMEFLCDFMRAAQAGELANQKIQLDLW
jgi:hypothetical protein